MRFFSGGQLPGVAENPHGLWWELQETYNPAHPQEVELFAEGRDLENRSAQSGTARFLLADPRRFIPVDAAGIARPGEFLRLNADGTLGAFEFRPDGRAPVNQQMNLSEVYKLPPGRISIALLPSPLANREKLPPGAPNATVPETATDIYLLVMSDPANKVPGRNLGFVITRPGSRTPRVLVFPDFREEAGEP